MPYLFLLLIITPIVELWIILKVGSAIGAGSTILLILLTAVLGAAMLRKQGFSTLFRARQKMQEGLMPAKEMAEGIMLAISGALMLTPGFVTDAIGFSLLVPWVRGWLIKRFQNSVAFYGAATSESTTRTTHFYSSDNGSETIIEGEFTAEAEPKDKKLL